MDQPSGSQSGSSALESGTGEVPALSPQGHPPEGGMSLDHLSDVLMAHYEKTGDMSVMAEIVRLRREALILHPQSHSNHALSLHSLADALMAQYQQVGDMDMLAEAIRLHSEALILRPHGHPYRGNTLNNLANALTMRYQQTGDRDALARVISLNREALLLRPKGHPGHGISLNNLATVLMMQYKQTGDIQSIAEIIRLHREALTLFPQGHSNRSMSLSNLSMALMEDYRHSGDIKVLGESISLDCQALDLRPRGHPERSTSLNNLATGLSAFYKMTGEIEALAEMIRLHREALALRPEGHPYRGSSLINLGSALMLHYQNGGDVDILAEAISLHRKALELHPKGHPDRGTSLNHLASALQAHYQKAGQTEVLAETICLYREALALYPQSHPERSMSLNNLASALMMHHSQAGGAEVLAEMICLHREALALRPQGHSEHGLSLSSLATVLMIHYQQVGDTDAMQETICLHREALVLHPPSHRNRGTSLNNLANALMIQYKLTGDMDTLAETIRMHREALALHPQGNPDRDMSLHSLSNALMAHYYESGDTEVLAEMITLHRETLLLRPQGHPDRSVSLNNLAAALMTHYQQAGGIEILAEVIRLHRNALMLRPLGHVDHGQSLNNLASSLLAYYEQAGDRHALEESINLHNEALALRPQGHPDRGSSLSNLASSHWAHFQRDGDQDALATALILLKEVLDVLPHGHPGRHSAHHNLAWMQLVDSPHFNWVESLNHLKEATTDDSVSPRNRLRQAIQSLRWVERTLARDFQQYSFSQSLLDVYVTVIQLLPRAAHVGLDLSTRLRELSGSEQLCRAASTRAMLLQQLPMAIEVFEEGKAVFWSQSLRLRSTALDALPSSDREKLSSLFRSLESDNNSFAGDSKDKANRESQIEHRRQMNKQADALIELIRTRPGFERFLKVLPFEELAKAAKNGFVVALVANEPLFFAIVIHANDAPKRILLPSVKADTLRKLRAQVSASGMRNYSDASEDADYDADRAMGKEKLSTRKDRFLTHSPLAQVWLSIVQPIILDLGLKRAPKSQRPRIHWYPSGDFALLPLHAAGIYEGAHPECAADFFVSSYTPSLSAIIKSREGFTPVPRKELRVLVFGEPSAPGQMYIPNVAEEVQVVAGLVLSASATVANDVDDIPTPQSVLDQLPAARILHLACHGQQDSDPLRSRFVLRDGPLTISELMKIDLPNAMMAFLSACDTAKGDKEQPDQAVHLAASMLFCGFRSVVATMWSMYDDDGPRMAQWFYEALLEKEMIDLNDIPYALDTAVRKLRATGAPAARWATYMHLGA